MKKILYQKFIAPNDRVIRYRTVERTYGHNNVESYKKREYYLLYFEYMDDIGPVAVYKIRENKLSTVQNKKNVATSNKRNIIVENSLQNE